MRYKIIIAVSLIDLAERVAKELSDGELRVEGGITIIRYFIFYRRYLQVLVTKENPK